MKCPHCHSEWNTITNIEQIIKNCPFCRKNLYVSETETSNPLKEILARIAARYGLELLKNGDRLIAVFADLAPTMEKELRLLKFFVEADCHTALFNVRNSTAAEQHLSIEECIRSMIDEFFIASDAAIMVCEAYWAAVWQRSTQKSANVSSGRTLTIRTNQTDNTSNKHIPSGEVAGGYGSRPKRTVSAKQKQNPGKVFQIAQGDNHVVHLLPNGTVEAINIDSNGKIKYGMNNHCCHVQSWTDIICIAAGDSHTVGLCSDGTVRAVGNNRKGQCDVNDWSNVIAIAASKTHTLGLCKDGTVRFAGFSKYNLCNARMWSDITGIATCRNHVSGILNDGTVLVIGENSYSRCNVEAFSDIVDIAVTSSNVCGLRKDGTPFLSGHRCEKLNVANVVAIDADDNNFICLHQDGTVSKNSSWSHSKYEWSNVVTISAGKNFVAGLKSDGTIVCTKPEIEKWLNDNLKII